jgi:hypothetical protein
MSVLTTPLTAPMVWAGGSGGTIRAFDADVVAWRDAVVANGGSVSLERMIIADLFVFKEKAADLWDLHSDYFPLWGENAPQAYTSLKQRRLATAVNSPTFLANRHVETDGVSSYLNLGYTPSLHSTAETGTNARLAVYTRDSGAATGYTVGVLSSSSRALRLRQRVSTTRVSTEIITGNTPSEHTLIVNNGAGYLAASRDASSAANYYVYKNGTALAVNGNPLSFGSSLPDAALFVGGFNNAGALSAPRVTQVGFVAIGACLSPSQEATHYANVLEWATAIGANV